MLWQGPQLREGRHLLALQRTKVGFFSELRFPHSRCGFLRAPSLPDKLFQLLGVGVGVG